MRSLTAIEAVERERGGEERREKWGRRQKFRGEDANREEFKGDDVSTAHQGQTSPLVMPTKVFPKYSF